MSASVSGWNHEINEPHERGTKQADCNGPKCPRRFVGLPDAQFSVSAFVWFLVPPSAALTVGETVVVEDLEEDVEDLVVRLRDLVEEDDVIGPAADGFGELAALAATAY